MWPSTVWSAREAGEGTAIVQGGVARLVGKAAPARCMCGRRASRAARGADESARNAVRRVAARFISILRLPWFRMFGDNQ